MKYFWKLPIFFWIVTSPSFSADCNHRTAYIEPECNQSCKSPETCEPADANNEEFCCINMEQPQQKDTPNLILISVVTLGMLAAGFQFWRVRRRNNQK